MDLENIKRLNWRSSGKYFISERWNEWVVIDPILQGNSWFIQSTHSIGMHWNMGAHGELDVCMTFEQHITIQDDLPGVGPELIIINHVIILRRKQNLATLYTSQYWPGACLPGSRHFLQSVNPSCLAGCIIREHRTLCRPVFRGGGDQLSPHLPRYVLDTFYLHRWIIVWFIIYNSGPPLSESSCIIKQAPSFNYARFSVSDTN
jgi:hypothetical protein